MPDGNSKHDQSVLAQYLPDDLRNSEVVRAFLSDPMRTVAAMITGALASGHEQMVLAGGHVAQAILKGRALKQLGKELDDLHKKGKIREDYADTKYGFHSLVDLMTMTESDAPDEDKLRAAKAMFVAVNSSNAPEGEAVMRYQLFRLVLKLSGPQLLLLSICNKLRKGRAFNENTVQSISNWLNAIANQTGHRVLVLIEQDETVLVQHGIITPRFQAKPSPFETGRPGVLSGVDLTDARLTDLGVKICELIETYSGAIPTANTAN